MNPRPPGTGTVVIGAGWAGLAAAVELTGAGDPVQVLESARQPGGRARCARFGSSRVDNGQHLLVGAYRETLRLLRRLGVDEARHLHRSPLHLSVRDADTRLELHAAPLPAPFHIALGLLRAQGLTLGQRLAALAMGYRFARARFTLDRDTTVAELLTRHRQPHAVSRRLWGPLCLAALNTPVERASARAFLSVLRDTFGRPSDSADLLIPRTDLGRLFAVPAMDFIESHGGRIQLAQRVSGLMLEGERIVGVETEQGPIAADHVVLATGPRAAARLLADHAVLEPIAARLQRLAYEPITTVYLQYPPEVRLPAPMLGSVGTLSQWLFDRRLCGQPGLLAVVISAGGTHMGLERERLCEAVARELAAILPDAPEPLRSTAIREKQATFACTAGVDRLRPGCRTPVRGLWLAGDYVDTGYPATLEGAVRSGLQCARHIRDNAPLSQAAEPPCPSHPIYRKGTARPRIS